MYLFKGVKELRKQLRVLQTANRSFGFVPTMGALHDGHLALVRRSLAENSFTICSIFVNPTQFNEASDLEKYPRTPSKDIEMLLEVGCDILFMPFVSEVYPAEYYQKPHFDFGPLDKVMEGAFRPGHFAGVAQVVYRLLEIVEPTRLYMGQKDYQQFLIVCDMLRQTGLSTQLVMYPIVREKDGLAMSSRNRRLQPGHRRKAGIIFEVLQQARDQLSQLSIDEIKKQSLERLSLPGFRPEYFEIVDADNLQPVSTVREGRPLIACTAVWAGDVRLIDNLFLQ